MANIIISGGTGLVGSVLGNLFTDRGDNVFIFTTQKNKAGVKNGLQYIHWDPKEKWINPEFRLADCSIINLAGANVAAERWTMARKAEILESRILSLQTLFDAVASGQLQACQLLSASAIGYYDDAEVLHTENEAAGNGFLSSVCRQWEAEAVRFRALNIPVAIARIGIVLSQEGGALKEFLMPLKYGLAAIPGNGQQMTSWIHIEDLCRMLIFLLDEKPNETYNAVAPNPVSLNGVFDSLLQIRKGLKFSMHIPSWILKIALGEMSTEILKSINVSSAKIQQRGFQFQHEVIGETLEDLLK